MDKERNLQLAQTMIHELDRGVEDNDFDLSDWEVQFVDSIRDQIEKGCMSEKQYDKLEEIHRRKI